MTYRKIYTIYHRQQSTRTGLNTHLTALHMKYCLLSWLFIRTIESERLFSAPQCISRCTISGTNGTFPEIRLVQYHSNIYQQFKLVILAFCWMTSCHSRIWVFMKCDFVRMTSCHQIGTKLSFYLHLSTHNFDFFFMKRGPGLVTLYNEMWLISETYF